MTTPTEGWDGVYVTGTPAWDIGGPQPVFVRLAEKGLLSGRVLDAGCGTGEHVLLAAQHGADAAGVDLAPSAIERAKSKAAERGLTARFEVGDALNLAQLGTTYDTLIDCGMFHVFGDAERPGYVASLASVLAPGGRCYLVCFSDENRNRGNAGGSDANFARGPRLIGRDEILAAFADGWEAESIEAEEFSLKPELRRPPAKAWLATLRRR